MSAQTVAKLRRLLEIEKAKSAAFKEQAEKWNREYISLFGDFCALTIRKRQAEEILKGERDE
jgi:hypothetical protein